MADIAASVLTRLKNKAQASGRSYQLCLQLFCQEEFLRRLEKSKYAENFVLKGGLFIYSLTEFDSRVTVDVDFLLRQKLIVSKDDIKDDFMGFAGRTDIDDEVEICIKRPKGAKKYPDNLIQAYFRENQKKQNSKIKRITIKGTNEAGKFEIDTDLMKMKHYLSVKGLTITNEVDSYDFFLRAQEFIDEMRNKQ